jgi:hypothetical protein
VEVVAMESFPHFCEETVPFQEISIDDILPGITRISSGGLLVKI